jgi:hypothetical protein
VSSAGAAVGLLGSAVRTGAAGRVVPGAPGWGELARYWWSVTNGRQVGYESWVERNVAMMLDFDPAVIAFASPAVLAALAG